MTDTKPAFTPKEFSLLEAAAQAIGTRECIDYMANIKGVFDKHQRFAFTVENFRNDLEREGFRDGKDSVKVWLPD